MGKMYHIFTHKRKDQTSLVDRGSNGGIAGNNVRRISTCSKKYQYQGYCHVNTPDYHWICLTTTPIPSCLDT